MKIVGCDFHPSFQQIAIPDTVSGEIEERRLVHKDGAAEQFYGDLGALALIGMEAVGNSLWFEQPVARLGHELWMVMQPRSGPAMCGGRRPIVAKRVTFFAC